MYEQLGQNSLLVYNFFFLFPPSTNSSLFLYRLKSEKEEKPRNISGTRSPSPVPCSSFDWPRSNPSDHQSVLIRFVSSEDMMWVFLESFVPNPARQLLAFIL
jgi:hypothetical protein